VGLSPLVRVRTKCFDPENISPSPTTVKIQYREEMIVNLDAKVKIGATNQSLGHYRRLSGNAMSSEEDDMSEDRELEEETEEESEEHVSEEIEEREEENESQNVRESELKSKELAKEKGQKAPTGKKPAGTRR